jgi:hypothetical protein
MASSVSVNSLVNDYMYKYDHNKNGVIDLKRPDGILNKLKNPDERVRSSSSTTFVPDGQGGDTINISSQVYSIRDLLYRADENHDDKVTREELDKVVRSYDKDGDGQLGFRGFWGWLTRKPKQEGDKFNDAYGEKLVNYGSVSI